MVKDRRVGVWVDALASKAPVPGGGGASALGGALGAALGQMVVHLTIGKKRYADVEEEMEKNLTELNRLGEEFLRLADRDGEVFAPLAEAYSMPSETREQREEKERVMEERLLAASLVPLEMMEKALLVINILEFLGEKGSRMALSVVGVASQFAKAALSVAAMNVYINTKAMKNREKAEELNRKAEWLIEDGKQRGDAVYEKVLEQLRHQCINGSC